MGGPQRRGNGGVLRIASCAVCAVIVASALAAGCRFELAGIDVPLLDDLGLVATTDMVVDAAQVGPAFAPSHVAPADVQGGAASLSGIRDLDTTQLLVDGTQPPPGVLFHAEPGHDDWAVLSVGDLELSADVTVHGRRGLIIVAVGTVHVVGVVHAEANHRIPGPGGQYTGQGNGGDGKSNDADDSGGGGAGHGEAGAPGGPSEAFVNNEGGAPGAIYVGDLEGGSGGGSGAGITSVIVAPCPTGANFSLGGGGGGSIQISAKIAINVDANGGINVGGGGGSGGCKDSASAGGGGGSGGTIWLEAPTMRLLGRLAANGGGGGSGGRHDVGDEQDGVDGDNGALDQVPARGGASSGDGSGAGGAGGARMAPAVPGALALNGGGGGAGVGRIRIRTHAVSPQTASSTIVSPAAMITADF